MLGDGRIDAAAWVGPARNQKCYVGERRAKFCGRLMAALFFSGNAATRKQFCLAPVTLVDVYKNLLKDLP